MSLLIFFAMYFTWHNNWIWAVQIHLYNNNFAGIGIPATTCPASFPISPCWLFFNWIWVVQINLSIYIILLCFVINVANIKNYQVQNHQNTCVFLLKCFLFHILHYIIIYFAYFHTKYHVCDKLIYIWIPIFHFLLFLCFFFFHKMHAIVVTESF